ncbi:MULTISPECIES: cyclopropane-fatty-acyl-phospholipid synthase family protein [Ralstonia solanacearum species complex]|uniref:Cyclopropane-fatty-acyl-phospholipid synthase family protein n=2 Tax=Ralstonia solanacearum species complex TaxID=3116862 RepID=A0A0S4WVS9_RALSL|nr:MULTISPECIES: cyclopropane-fatty-acyl-phospholipid synthase family protein [Ralstonia]AXW15649.1 class I SAM-dependent methyltransferase [Ralstonia solanacearum]AXW39208.1 class I SAM-dependent methyltransferase [Ralstonia solanacearum]MBX9431751.1 cyclopropane-fatty-acyl-phospholipid synthase family protein [Ralstonia pseudosolanacearum]MCF1443126.1 cyclopropane-fatty-acyl-phospholipid synthase family protein [Ralstonia solanacearum]MCK4124207.1 class I SAM-dependent methyltransferase [Ral
MFFQQAIDRKLEHWISDIRASANLPVLLRLWNGHQYPLGRFERPTVTLTVREASALPLLLSPTLNNLGEAYVQEKIDLDGRLPDIISVGYQLAASAAATGSNALARVVRHFAHTKEGDKASIRYHYDVSNDFYKLWLDRNMVYSCAYFEHGDETLDDAQIKKIDHILTKIRLQPDQTLLDIGCGWGALVLRAAQQFGARCLGVTLSQNQFDLARERVRAAGLEDRIEIRLQDYRDLTGAFDRITSVGMFEHVGRKNLPGYFRRVHSLLADNGIAMNHGITSSDPEGGESSLGGGDFIDRYVFPQGELPHISLALRAAQEGGLEALDVESLRRHYARTLEHWADRFETNGETIRKIVGEKTYRIWRVYLAGCAHAFDADEVSIFQILCQKSGKPAASIPWSRRYIYR